MQLLSYSICFLLCINALAQSLKPTYPAGFQVVVDTKPEVKPTHLLVKHAYGSQVLLPDPNMDALQFIIPLEITKKTGTLTLVMYSHSKRLWTGHTNIVADTTQSHVEAYCGPKHLIVGGDYAMLTASILDRFDNPYPIDAAFSMNTLIRSEQKTVTIRTDGLLGFARIYSPSTRGNGAVSAQHGASGTKEFRLDFYANSPEDYEITYQREHEYADANQMITLQTTPITDAMGNQVENGTMVAFNIWDDQNRLTQLHAETINGIATSSLPAPIAATTWRISSTIRNYAESPEIQVTFKSAIKDFPVVHDRRSLTIGPVLSFMGQYIKEGTLVHLELSGAKNYHFELSLEQAMCSLSFKHRFIDPGQYRATIRLGDITKQINLEVSDE